MRSLRWLLVLPVVLLLASCGSSLGRHPPQCDEPTGSLVLSVQSVPGTAYAPCIHGLKTGWEYEHLEAQRGQSVFYLDSDRLGGGDPFAENPFLKVSLLPACDVSGAVEVDSDERGVPLFVDVEVDFEVQATVVPDSRNVPTVDYAKRLQRALDGILISDRTLLVEVDTGHLTVSERIKAARVAGHAVLVVSARDAEDRTATLLLAGSDDELVGLELKSPASSEALDVGEVVEELEEVTSLASYTGTWYYPFANGCVVYSFDAHGSGVGTIESDVQAALGLYDAESLRQVARDLGYNPG